VSVVSMSFGIPESSSDLITDSLFTTLPGHQGVTFLAATGDTGIPGGYPAFSSNVVAVGGSTLNVDSNGNYLGEAPWPYSGGGITSYETQGVYQIGKVNGLSSTYRTIPDVAMDADPNTGVYIFDSSDDSGPVEIAGTSLACPMWAGLIAVANQGRVARG